MRSRLMILLIPALLVTLGTLPTQAAWTSSLDYFETQVTAACMASNTQSPGTYIRNIKDSYQCSGLTVYHVVHGGGTYPWSTESFYVKDGYLWQMIEIFINESNGDITSYRAFREQVNHWKGIPVLKTWFNGSDSWSYPPYHEEYWTNGSGDPVCYNTHQNWVWGSVNWTRVSHAGTYTNWIQDKRASSADPNAWHDVEVIVRTDQWGSNNYEYYHYARWFNPSTSQWEGLGLIKWEWYSVGQLKNQAEHRYIVDCNVSVSCSTCPP